MYFNTFDGDKLIAKEPLSWEKSLCMGVVTPHALRNCNECEIISLCDKYDKLVNQSEEFSANLNESKRQAPNE